ncbi:hypothetical protein HPP92_013593 [Vanilla planifolia]|uniref:PAS fold-2 domain-containing protein n=1 Tax=Vanilla planifolia TaxID=51239 RepID=A0A835QYV4_VANPL|nr:hypothetical protein HPP92_013593 [Vanilla planifolia]
MSSKSNKGSGSRSGLARSKHSARVVAQTSLDAKLDAEFEDSEQPFDYSTSMGAASRPTSRAGSSGIPSSSVSAYLQRMQRGQFIQPFGCMVLVDSRTFAIIAYSENAPEMLDLAPHAVPSIEQQQLEALTIGMDARTLFRSPGSIALQKAASFGRSSGKPFMLFFIELRKDWSWTWSLLILQMCRCLLLEH